MTDAAHRTDMRPDGTEIDPVLESDNKELEDLHAIRIRRLIEWMEQGPVPVPKELLPEVDPVEAAAQAVRIRELLDWMERESGPIPEDVLREVEALYDNPDPSRAHSDHTLCTRTSMVALDMTEAARRTDAFSHTAGADATAGTAGTDDELEAQAARIRELLDWMEQESGPIPEEIKREVDALFWNENSS